MSRELDNINRIRAGPAAGGKRPEDMSPQELHSVLWQVLTFRDSVVKKISKTPVGLADHQWTQEMLFAISSILYQEAETVR